MNTINMRCTTPWCGVVGTEWTVELDQPQPGLLAIPMFICHVCQRPTVPLKNRRWPWQR
jgi:hypothetical protein